MLGTPKTEAFEERVKTLVRAAWKAGKTDDEILAELERAIRDPATPVDSLTSSLRRLRTQPSRFCLVPCPWFHGSEPSPSFTRTTTATPSFNGVPSFFRCSCQEASTGGTHSYKWAGRALAQNVHRLIPDGMTGDEWREQLDDTRNAVEGRTARGSCNVARRLLSSLLGPGAHSAACRILRGIPQSPG